MARRLGRPVIAFGGRVEEAARIGLCDCFDQIVTLSDVEPMNFTPVKRFSGDRVGFCGWKAFLQA